MAGPSNLRIQLYFDDEAHNWHFHVPELHIVGGGQTTVGEALKAVDEAIEFTVRNNDVAAMIAEMRAEFGPPSAEDYAWADHALGLAQSERGDL
jgi:hypothetical protein